MGEEPYGTVVGWWLGTEVGHVLREWTRRKGDARGIQFQVSGCSGMCVEQFLASPDSYREKAVDALMADHCPSCVCVWGSLTPPQRQLFVCCFMIREEPPRSFVRHLLRHCICHLGFPHAFFWGREKIPWSHHFYMKVHFSDIALEPVIRFSHLPVASFFVFSLIKKAGWKRHRRASIPLLLSSLTVS